MTPDPEGPRRALRFEDRLLAEGVRVLERLAGPVDDPAADAAARAAEGGDEERVVARARALAVADDVRGALLHVGQVAGGVAIGGVVAAVFAGSAAAGAALGFGREEQINVFAVLGGLLGFQLLMLAAWLASTALRLRPGRGGALGAALIGLARWIAARARRGAAHEAAALAHGEVLVGPPGRWTFGFLSNAAWTAFNVGALATLVYLLSTRHYLFVWETTLLSDAAFVRFTEFAGRLPALLGFDVPDAELVRATQWAPDLQPAEASRRAWSGFLIGSLLVYGLAPRVLTLYFCGWRRRRARERYRLDLGRPEYVRLLARWAPRTADLGVVDPHDGRAPAAPEAAAAVAERPAGPPAILSVEIEPPETGWPPRLDGVAWDDLGAVDDGDARRRVLAELSRAPTEPAVLAIVCDLTSTPDRGVGHALQRLRESVARPALLVLTAGEALRRRQSVAAFGRRVEDWRALAERAGFAADRVVEVDLDHLTHASRARLAQLVPGARAREPGEGADLAAQFERIARRAEAWGSAPDDAQRAELARELAAAHGGAGGRWRSLLGAAATASAAELPGALRGGAERALALLPERLRASPRWLAAGAAAGALGCVAATLLVTPAALAALPAWSALGAATTAAARAFAPRKADAAAPEPGGDAGAGLDEAVRSAALLAMLLDLQGEDETTITRVLDRALEADDAALRAPADARPWLDAQRRRFDAARAEVGAA